MESFNGMSVNLGNRLTDVSLGTHWIGFKCREMRLEISLIQVRGEETTVDG